MTEQEVTDLGPAFAAYLRRFRPCFRQDRTGKHFDTSCRGRLTDLPRASVEPMALAAGAAVRTSQQFLTTATWRLALAQLARREAAGVGCDGWVFDAGFGVVWPTRHSPRSGTSRYWRPRRSRGSVNSARRSSTEAGTSVPGGAVPVSNHATLPKVNPCVVLGHHRAAGVPAEMKMPRRGLLRRRPFTAIATRRDTHILNCPAQRINPCVGFSLSDFPTSSTFLTAIVSGFSRRRNPRRSPNLHTGDTCSARPGRRV